MRGIYDFFGITRQAHHQQMRRQCTRQAQEQEVLDRVRALRILHPRMGGRKLSGLLAPLPFGITAFENLLSAHDLTVPRLHRHICTTLRSSDGTIITNLTHGLSLNDINQLWVSDISYLIDGSQTYYLVHLLDVYSRRLLATSISQSLRSEENLRVLAAAIAVRGTSTLDGLIHHSDAGRQYTSTDYLQALSSAGIRPSIAETCLQNAYSERINGTIKHEYLDGTVATGLTLDQWSRRLAEVELLYNYHRPHQSLGYRTPVDFERHIAALDPSQRPVLVLHDFRQVTDVSAQLSHTPSPRETGDTSCQPMV